MKTILQAIQRAVVYFQMRAVEINLEGMIEAREKVADPFTRVDMAPAIANARAEALRLREKYLALRRPAQSWRAA